MHKEYTFIRHVLTNGIAADIFDRMKTEAKGSITPNVFTYYDYREFLKDLFSFHKSQLSVFSNRYIVRRAGYKSPTTLKQVIDGRRNLSAKSAERFAAVFNLNKADREYFLKLVHFNQAKSLEQRNRYYNELLELQKGAETVKLDETKHEVLAKWWHLVIREAIALPDAKNSSKWISRALTPSVPQKEVLKSLRGLKKLGMIKKKDTKWEPADSILETDPKVLSVLAAGFHRQMIGLGSESITRFLEEEREISGTTLRIAGEDVKAMKELIRNFRKKALSLANKSMNANQVYQMNIQFFPVVALSRNRRMK